MSGVPVRASVPLSALESVTTGAHLALEPAGAGGDRDPQLERAATTRLPSARVRRLLAAVSSLDGDSSLSGLLRLCA